MAIGFVLITLAVLAGYHLLLGLLKYWQTIRAAQLMRQGRARPIAKALTLEDVE